MITLRQIERNWTAKSYARLFREVAAARPEADFHLEIELDRPIPAAAMALVRIEELNQCHSPLYGRLLRTLLAAQEADGGWGDPVTTALCVRALLCGSGDGPAIARGLHYLANLQKSEGIWPSVPLRRMPADPHVSAFILYELGEYNQFRSAVRCSHALSWFEAHDAELDPQCRQLWDLASMRCRFRAAPQRQESLLWS